MEVTLAKVNLSITKQLQLACFMFWVQSPDCPYHDHRSIVMAVSQWVACVHVANRNIEISSFYH